MTETTSPPKDAADAVRLTEGYWRYRVDFATVSARTDTPDLMRIFGGGRVIDEDALLAEGYREMAEEDREFAASALTAGLETLPTE